MKPQQQDQAVTDMSDPDAAARFRRMVAGQLVTVDIESAPVETIDGTPLGVDPPMRFTFAFDPEGLCLPMWESDE